jgi:hypothetical protein
MGSDSLRPSSGIDGCGTRESPSVGRAAVDETESSAQAQTHAEVTARAFSEPLNSKPTIGSIVLFVLFGSVAEVMATLWRSAGQRVAGIRVADAKTGRTVTLRQAIILSIAPPCEQWLIGWLTRPLNAPDRPVIDHTRASEDLKRIHAGDREAMQEAMLTYFREQPRPRLWRELLPRLLAQVALQRGIDAVIHRRWPGRSLKEVLAGTAVVVDR